MKKPGKLVIAFIAMAASAGTLATSQTAVADGSAAPEIRTYSAANGDTPPPELVGPNGEKPTEWGSASFQVGANLQSRVSKGGGTWNYGTRRDGIMKGCYSNYIHPKKKHSATVSIADETDKAIAKKDVWAKAYAKAGGAYKCSAYWGVY